MSKLTLAFDSSARSTDADGRLHVARSHISKATVNPYYGQEIPGWESLGLSPDRVYHLLRDPVELERGAHTFARLPILAGHTAVSADEHNPGGAVVGTIGSNVSFTYPYLDADLCVWAAEAIAGIESNQVRELSCSYRYVPVMQPGEFESVQYDGRMTDIRGNHLALVETGRAGPDVLVSDSNPFTTEDNMNPGEPKADDESPAGKLRALLAGKCGDDVIDAACALLCAPAADSDPDEPKADDSDEPKADDDAESDAEKDPEPKEPADPVAEDSDKPTEPDKPAMDAALAMDALRATVRAEVMAEMKLTADALRDVFPVVGDLAMDSAEDVYTFALKHLKVEVDGVTGAKALRSLFKAATRNQPATPPVMAADSADVSFPGVARFRNA